MVSANLSVEESADLSSLWMRNISHEYIKPLDDFDVTSITFAEPNTR